MTVTIRETFEEMQERCRRFEDAKRRANDPKTPWHLRKEAVAEMWEPCLGPAPRRERVKRVRTHPCD